MILATQSHQGTQTMPSITNNQNSNFTSIQEIVAAYDKLPADNSSSYSTTDVNNTDLAYDYNFQVGEENNLKITSFFDTADQEYNLVKTVDRVKIQRVDNSQTKGEQQILWFEQESRNNTEINVKPTAFDTMTEALSGDIINRGVDNLFTNSGNNEGNVNNIERVDYITNQGLSISENGLDDIGFLVMERGGNDPFKIAAITAIDELGNPTAFSTTLREVSPADWGTSSHTINSEVMRQEPGDTNPRSTTTLETQSIAGVFISYADLGITADQTFYGFALFPIDINADNDLVGLSDFPTDTPENENNQSVGGLDLIASGSVFMRGNLPPEIINNDGEDTGIVIVTENNSTVSDVESIDDNDTEGNGLTYTITGGEDQEQFNVDTNTGELSFNNSPDFETPTDSDGDNSYQVEVTVTDSEGLEDIQTLTVSVEDVEETIEAEDIIEEVIEETTVEQEDIIEEEDITEPEDIIEEVVEETIEPEDVVEDIIEEEDITEPEDIIEEVFEETTEPEDIIEEVVEEETIEAEDIVENTSPEIINHDGEDTGIVIVTENNSTVSDVESIDDNDTEGNGLTYTITGGEDQEQFNVDTNTGELSFNNSPDFETPTDSDGDNSYQVEVTVTDSEGLEDIQTLTVSVEDVEETIEAEDIIEEVIEEETVEPEDTIEETIEPEPIQPENTIEEIVEEDTIEPEPIQPENTIEEIVEEEIVEEEIVEEEIVEPQPIEPQPVVEPIVEPQTIVKAETIVKPIVEVTTETEDTVKTNTITRTEEQTEDTIETNTQPPNSQTSIPTEGESQTPQEGCCCPPIPDFEAIALPKRPEITEVASMAAMIEGSETDDVLIGNGLSEAIISFGGNDILNGLDENDWIEGGDGNDHLRGDMDNDTLIGNAGNDTMLAGRDDQSGVRDVMGQDWMLGGDGDDFLSGNENQDMLMGDVGNDIAYGGKGDDQIFGDAGNDHLFGDEGNDTIIGTNGDENSAAAGNEEDMIYGYRHNDLIQGGPGKDMVFSGKDDDFAYGGKDDDMMWGDLGFDTIYGDKGDDTLFGDTNDPNQTTSEGQDLMWGGAGNDFIDGNRNDDTLSGGEGDDIVRGGKGNDQVFGDVGNDELYGDLGNDTVCGNEGDDTLFGDTENENTPGGQDLLCGGSGDDVIMGNRGQDKLCGCEGDDTLFAGQEDDLLKGKTGDDWLFGDLGNDTLIGGEGRDRFVVADHSGLDLITDFQLNQDFILLGNSLTFSDLEIIQQETSVAISLEGVPNSPFAILENISAEMLSESHFITP